MTYDEQFEEFFTRILLKTASCFERDVLRDCKGTLKEAYIRRAREVDNSDKPDSMKSLFWY